MPIYEYKCRACSHQFEYLVLPTSPAPECPACRDRDLEKLISLCAVSSESTSQANLRSARKKAAGIQKEKQHEEHKLLHEHHD
jgi:putative FmdB family regulatory protein